MLKRNVKILKYIKSHPYVTCQTIQNKFNLPELDTVETLLHNYIVITNKEPDHDQNGDETGEKIPIKNSKVSCTGAGLEFLEEWSDNNSKWKIPIAISSIALFKSFLPEICAVSEVIWKALEKLLPQ